MEFQRPSLEIIPFGLRAMKTIAMANGELAQSERNLLETARDMFGSDVDIDALTPIEPVELAAAITDPAKRKQLVRGMTIVSLIDGEASAEEAALVKRYADALGVSSPDLEALQHFAEQNLLRARFDIARRFFAREKAVELAKERGLMWAIKTLAAFAGIAEDSATAKRYRDLEHAPAGSLGRGYYDFIMSNGYSFPGEKGSPPEVISFHDLTHVLSGYGTDPEGELQVLAFHAGCRREERDPFSFIMFGVVEFHMGLGMSPVAKPSKGKLDLRKLIVAIERGGRCSIDPTHGWDPWLVMNEPLDLLRERYGITPP
jgi:tellurite resistance protein